MFEGRTIGVVVPAYNEERLIRKTLETMPDLVDTVIVVDDGSRDGTGAVIADIQKAQPRVQCITHEVNRGLGRSLIDGYLRARELGLDVVAVMAGDAQMAPSDLPRVVGPVARGRVDYVKGNRLLRADVSERMPRHRFLGNSVLTLLTKFATGYWRIIDPQCGYTAIGKAALARIPIERLTTGYGYNADLLQMLNLGNHKVCDVEVEPVYGEEQSKIKLGSYIPKVSLLLLRLFGQRMRTKYLLREFHPLVFFYLWAAFNLFVVTIPIFLNTIRVYFFIGQGVDTHLIIGTFSSSMAMLSLFFGMWLDMEDNQRLFVGDLSVGDSGSSA